MRDLSLHLLDIIQNSVKAASKEIYIEISIVSKDFICFVIEDDGKGMDFEFLKKVTDPFTTARSTRKVGLGLPLLKEACELAGGDLSIQSKVGVGTKIEGKMRISSIDRIPIGNIGETFMTLALSADEINYKLRMKNNNKLEFLLDFSEIKEELEGIPLSEISVATWIKEIIEQEKIKIFGGNLNEIINPIG